MREALYMIDADEVYVVPDFISEGYFTQEVIPREMQLEGPTTRVRGKWSTTAFRLVSTLR